MLEVSVVLKVVITPTDVGWSIKAGHPRHRQTVTKDRKPVSQSILSRLALEAALPAMTRALPVRRNPVLVENMMPNGKIH